MSENIKNLRHELFERTQALIYVFDSTDHERISVAYDNLQELLREDKLKYWPVLVFANKQDKPNAMSADEVTDKLGLQNLRNRAWHVQATCATSGEGLYEGLDWLSMQ